MKIITITISVFTLTCAIRVPPSWTSPTEEHTNNNRYLVRSLPQRLPVYVNRLGYQQQTRPHSPHVAPQPYVPRQRIILQPTVRRDYINRNNLVYYKPKIHYPPSKLIILKSRPTQNHWAPVVHNTHNYPPIEVPQQKNRTGDILVSGPQQIQDERTPVEAPTISDPPVDSISQNLDSKEEHFDEEESDDVLEDRGTAENIEKRPVYLFDSNFNPVTQKISSPYDPFSGGYPFLPLPKYENNQRLADPRSPLNKNYRDDKTHEPIEVEDSERVSEDVQEEEREEDEEENAPISDHEAPVDGPTRPIYPGEGKWAQRGVKHRPYVSNHKYEKLEDGDEEKPDGYEVFQKVGDVFQKQSNRFAGDLATLPRNHKLGNYINPEEEENHNHKEEYNEEDDKEELNEDEEDDEFVPVQVYSQVRRSEDEEHLPPIHEGPQNLKEVIKDSKIQTVYTEEGYEDVAYDHAGHEKEAAESEGFAEAEEHIKEEKLKKARPHNRLNIPGDSAIEESNYDNAKSVVTAKRPNHVSTQTPHDGKYNKPKSPKMKAKSNNNFMKTKEIKTTSVKDAGNGTKTLEISSEIKVMVTPNNGTKTHKYVKILPKIIKYEREPKRKVNIPEENNEANDERLGRSETEDQVPTTVQPEPPSLPDAVTDEIPIPSTSTQALQTPVIDKTKNAENKDIYNTRGSNKMSLYAWPPKKLHRKKRFTNDFPEIEVDTAFIDKIKHQLPVKIDRTREKYPYYFIEGINRNSPLRYSEDLDNIPVKIGGELSFYEQAHNNVACEEVQSDVDPVPDRVKSAEKNAEEMKQSDDVEELAPSPRLRNLGDKIRCFKKRYFGENPLDSPFFKEELIDPVTPPYKMHVPEWYEAAVRSSTLRSSESRTNSGNTDDHQKLSDIKSIDQKNNYITPWLGKIKLNRGPIPRTNDDPETEKIEENASSVSETNSEDETDGTATEENEIESEDNAKILKENLEDLNREPDEIIEKEENRSKEEYSDYTGSIEDILKIDKSENDEEDDSQNVTDEVLAKVREILNSDEPSADYQEIRETKKEEQNTDEKVLKDVLGTRNEDVNTTNNVTDESNGTITKAEIITTMHPDAEVISVEKLPEPTQPPVINIITTPNYTIDLQPKHIYDQIKLLGYLPGEQIQTTTAKIEQTTQNNLSDEKTIDRSFEIDDNTTNINDINRQPRTFQGEKILEKPLNEEQDSDNQPESLPLKHRRRKLKRRKPLYHVFDVTKYWPTTPPPPLFSNPVPSTVLPKHKVHSEVHYKDEIKPSEQLNVFADVLNTIKNSPPEDPLLVSESQNIRAEGNIHNRPRIPAVKLAHYNPYASVNNFPLNYQHVPVVYKGIHNFENSKNFHFSTPVPLPTQTHRINSKNQVGNLENHEDSNEELPIKLKSDAHDKRYPIEEQDEIDYYTSQDIGKINDSKIRPTTLGPLVSTVAQNNKKSSKREQNIDYIQGTKSEVLGLVPPGNDRYRTIYKPKPQKKVQIPIHSTAQESQNRDQALKPQFHIPQTNFQVNDDALVNRYFVVGMKPPEQQNIYPYREFKMKNPQRRINKRHRYRRAVAKPSYTEVVRSRGPQFQATSEAETADDNEDDYVPHRPKNYHYDTKTGRIVYDNAEKKEEDDEELIEDAEIYEEATEKHKKSDASTSSTISWIATAKPDKNEPSILHFINKLRNHPGYKLIPDPTTTEKAKGDLGTTPKIDVITPEPKSTTPPPFLNILAKLKGDSSYKLIPDKTTAKSTTSTSTTTEIVEIGEKIEESKVENIRNAPGEQQLLGDIQIFDISEFLPKTRNYQPRTAIDYSKYKSIERPQASTRHNLSSRYNAENDKQLQEVNTKKVPLHKDSDSIEYPAVSESRVEENIPDYTENEEVTSTTTEKSTSTKVTSTTTEKPTSTKSPRRRILKKSRSTSSSTSTTEPTSTTASSTTEKASTTEITTTSTVATPKTIPSTTTAPTTLSTTLSTSSTTIVSSSTTPTTTIAPATPSKRIRTRGRIRATSAKPSTRRSLSSATTSTTTEQSTTKRASTRRRPARIKIRTTTERFINEDDVEDTTKTVKRRHQSQNSYFNRDSSERPSRLAPIIVADVREDGETPKIQFRRVPETTTAASEDFGDSPRKLTVPLPIISNFEATTETRARRKRIRNQLKQYIPESESSTEEVKILKPLGRKNKHQDAKQTQSKKIDVEIVNDYDQKQRHGGNYKSETEDQDKEEINAEIEPLEKDNDETTSTENATKSKDVEVIKEYDLKQKHGGNYRKLEDPEEAEVIHIEAPKRSRGRSINNHRVPAERLVTRQNGNKDTDETQSKKINVEVFAEYDRQKPHGGNYRKEIQDNDNESTSKSESPHKTRGRLIDGRLSQHKKVDVEVFKAYDPKNKHGGNYRREKEDLKVKETEPTETSEHEELGDEGEEDEKSADTAKNSSDKSQVEVFTDYDNTKKHGGNYRELQNEETQRHTVSKSTLEKKPHRGKKTERLTDVVPKPFAFYTDPKLPNNINKLKESATPDAAIEDIAEEVAESGDIEEETDDYDDVFINFRSASSTTTSTTTTTRKPPVIIKDPGKRLYYYVSI